MTTYNEVDYSNMLAYFQINDLQTLLGTFGQNIIGQRDDLLTRALQLISSRPISLNYVAYVSKIYEIYSSVQSAYRHHNMICNSMPTQQNQMMPMGHIQTPQASMYQLPQASMYQLPQASMYQLPQASMYQLPQYSQQPMAQAGFPHFTTKMEGGGMYENPTGANTIPENTMANNYIQPVEYGTQEQFQMPSNEQHMNAMEQNTPNLILSESTGESSNAFYSSPQNLFNYKFNKLTFYDVIHDIVKPTPLVGSESCIFPGTVEFKLDHILTREHVNLILKNRDVSIGKNEYNYQYQIRICQFEYGSSAELTDYFPIGLKIRINKRIFPFPPSIRGPESRRSGKPINCAQYLKLNPTITNTVTINWIPDEKNYAVAVYIVKKISVDDLMEKLQANNVRSSEETKNVIIQKLTSDDPDFAATAYDFSLVCPLSKIRMKIPAKSIHCDHVQCFDLGTFIFLNETKPRWKCPICNKSCLSDEIRIENYFLEIVTNPTLQDNINDIKILADGSWTISERNMNSAVVNEVNPIDSIILDDSDNEKSVDLGEEGGLGGLECQKSKKFKPNLVVDLTMDEDESSKQLDKPENMAQEADARQSGTKS